MIIRAKVLNNSIKRIASFSQEINTKQSSKFQPNTQGIYFKITSQTQYPNLALTNLEFNTKIKSGDKRILVTRVS